MKSVDERKFDILTTKRDDKKSVLIDWATTCLGFEQMEDVPGQLLYICRDLPDFAEAATKLWLAIEQIHPNEAQRAAFRLAIVELL
ncbi:TPA: hypothetical protein DEP96_00465 [Candidatus Uhrbacteria bacterium]|nr:hypothetical protein [Candidatus Uhrbacteria bacterium]